MQGLDIGRVYRVHYCTGHEVPLGSFNCESNQHLTAERATPTQKIEQVA